MTMGSKTDAVPFVILRMCGAEAVSRPICNLFPSRIAS